jgi:predicted aspartyl protease
MGVFYTSCRITNPNDRSRSVDVPSMLVDAGSECTWVAATLLDEIGVAREAVRQSFLLADGRTITRPVGYALVRVGADITVDEVVFAEPGELQLLGARTLEGLRLRVDPVQKTLVPTGPAPAACA